MEKVKVTQAQADAIQDYISFHIDNEFNLTTQFKHFVQSPMGEKTWMPLVDFEPEKFALLLCGWYEVEPEFEVGDWVTWQAFDGKLVGKVLDIDEFDRVIKTDIRNRKGTKLQFSFGDSELRHATPSEIAEEKERRWWGLNNRDVWELEEGDLLKNLHNKHVYEILNIDELSVSLDDSLDYRNKEEIKDGFIIACFYQNRLDVKTNE